MRINLQLNSNVNQDERSLRSDIAKVSYRAWLDEEKPSDKLSSLYDEVCTEEQEQEDDITQSPVNINLVDIEGLANILEEGERDDIENLSGLDDDEDEEIDQTELDELQNRYYDQSRISNNTQQFLNLVTNNSSLGNTITSNSIFQSSVQQQYQHQNQQQQYLYHHQQIFQPQNLQQPSRNVNAEIYRPIPQANGQLLPEVQPQSHYNQFQSNPVGNRKDIFGRVAGIGGDGSKPKLN